MKMMNNIPHPDNVGIIIDEELLQTNLETLTQVTLFMLN